MGVVGIYPIVNRLGGEKAPLLQVLLAVQDLSRQNYISEEAVNTVAHYMKIPRSRVYSTASFYSEISLKPRGAHLIRVCTNAPCENEGKKELVEAIENELEARVGETTEDGLFTLESVSCLGACYMSPAIKVDDTVYGHMTPEEAVAIIKSIREEHRNVDTV